MKLTAVKIDWFGVLAHVEASIDFSTEGLETVSSTELLEKLKSVQTEVGKWVESYQIGRKIHSGVSVRNPRSSPMLGNPVC